MKVLRQLSELRPAPGKACVAIGMFDGVHLGHQQVLRQTLADARQHSAAALAVTFDRHPNQVVCPDRAPALIYRLSQRLRVLESLGLDAVWLIEFDQTFSQQPGELFVRNLVRDLGHLHSVCVGSTFAFGHKRSGDVALLKRLGQELHFQVHGLAAVSLDGEIVSSTRIRERIRSGNLDAASQMLGRPYSLAGNVVPGDGLGKKLGFPTANLRTTNQIAPPAGVYAVQAQSVFGVYGGALNIGCRPTLEKPDPELRIEIHLLDFNGDLYGQELEVTFVEKIRDEQKFPSLDELKAQIGRDIGQARFILG